MAGHDRHSAIRKIRKRLRGPMTRLYADRRSGFGAHANRIQHGQSILGATLFKQRVSCRLP